MKSISEREDTSKKVYDSSVAPKLSSRDGFLCYKYVKIIYNYIFKDILTNFADCVEYRVQFHKKHGNNIDVEFLIVCHIDGMGDISLCILRDPLTSTKQSRPARH